MTAKALRAGGLAAVAVFAVALVLRVAGLEAEAETIALVGVVVTIATAPAALLATILETFRGERGTATLAAAVLAVLGVATAISLFLR